MLNHLFDRVTLVALATLLGACSTADVVVPIDTAQIVSSKQDAYRSVQVQVTDIRREANLERTTIGGVSMGRITLKPPAPELVQAVVEASAYKALASRSVAEPQTVLCGIRVFEIATPATPLYWDINAKIELVLRVRGQDRTVSGTATERTFVWPTEALIERVTTEALRQVSAESEQALETLFALPR
ncbi:MAG: hypothetical protein H6R08_2098 [Proteobacteria bacterium]|nr:hypothetical protein [Pseudomonadota bacterium]